MKVPLLVLLLVMPAVTVVAETRRDDGVLDRANDPDRIVCRRVNRQGSFIKTRVCSRNSEWMEERRRSLYTIDRLRQLDPKWLASVPSWRLS